MFKILGLLLLSFPLFANQLQVDSIESMPGLEANFTLKDTSDDSFSGNLNCQSFFKKLDLYDIHEQMVSENYLTMQECRFFYNSITKCIDSGQYKCIDFDNLFNNSCSCN
ncbi:MAG: hypothetical protein HON90_13820 [Halobacteriovoraceae bacterium]|jgi:hypothetical protein|nr:hypothetical protein [Halobacteriovoraceae bacterium]